MSIGGVDLSKGKTEKYQITFNLTPEEATLIVKDLKGNIVQPKEKNIYMLETGIYTYTISAENYITKENIRLEVYQETIIDIKLDKSYNLINFKDASEEELARMLNAHYNGEIDVADYWHIGDTRTIHINDISANSYTDYALYAQDVEVVIIGFNHDTLKEQLGERTKSAVTLQFKNLRHGCEWEGKYTGGSYANTYTWKNSGMKKYLNNQFLKALPEKIQPLIKVVLNPTIYRRDLATVDFIEDSIFWLSCSEVFGDEVKNITYYEGNATAEGEQYEYHKIPENRKLGLAIRWWLRSHSTQKLGGSYSYNFYVESSGEIGSQAGQYTAYIAPAFCL